jgi:hypothetical protein
MGNISTLDSGKISFLKKFNGMGFKVDEESVSAVGFYNGIRFTISIEGCTYMISTSVRSGGLLPEDDFLRYIVSEVDCIRDAVYQNNRVTFVMQNVLFAEKIMNSIIDAMGEVSELLKKSGFINVCEICGESVDSIESYDINGRVFDLCDDCHEDCDYYVQARKCLDDSVRENIPRGILFGLIGGLVGAAGIVLSINIGGLSTWLGALLAYCLLLGYSVGSKKMSRFGLIFCGFMTVALTYLSCRVGFTMRYVSWAKGYGEHVDFLSAFTNFYGIYKRDGLLKGFFEAVSYCSVFGLVLVAGDLVAMIRKRKTRPTDVIIEIPEERHFYTAV